MAIGILVVPDDIPLIRSADFGTKYPSATPIAIAKNIHKVR
jgi:hypothetical protein